MATTLFTNVQIITPTVVAPGDVLVDGALISAVGAPGVLHGMPRRKVPKG